MATQFKYLLVDCDGNVYGTNDGATAAHYADGDFIVVKFDEIPEIEAPEDEDEDE